MTWYKEWFGEDYLSTYPHRNREEAEQQVSFLLSRCPLSDSNRILDIASGNGRHLAALCNAGYCRVTGIDLSWTLLERARGLHEAPGEDCRAPFLVQADMRQLPFPPASFDLITNFFTGFGYFETDQEHLLLLKEWRRVLRDGGALFLDYLNRDHVVDNLVGESVREQDGMKIREVRRLSTDGRRVLKDIFLKRIGADEDSPSYRESVMMYSPAEVESLLAAAGFAVAERFGNFHGEGFHSASERLILIARCVMTNKVSR